MVPFSPLKLFVFKGYIYMFVFVTCVFVFVTCVFVFVTCVIVFVTCLCLGVTLTWRHAYSTALALNAHRACLCVFYNKPRPNRMCLLHVCCVSYTASVVYHTVWLHTCCPCCLQFSKMESLTSLDLSDCDLLSLPPGVDVCVCVFVCVSVCVCVAVRVCVWLCVCASSCPCHQVWTCVCLCVCASVCVCVAVCMCGCSCVCVCLCVCILMSLPPGLYVYKCVCVCMPKLFLSPGVYVYKCVCACLSFSCHQVCTRVFCASCLLLPLRYTCRIGQDHIYTVHIRYFWQGNHQIYSHIRCIHTVLANPIHLCKRACMRDCAPTHRVLCLCVCKYMCAVCVCLCVCEYMCAVCVCVCMHVRLSVTYKCSARFVS